MGLEEAIKELKFDKRMQDWNLRNGKLTKEEHEQYLQSLEDCSANAIALDLGDSSNTDALSAAQPPVQEQAPMQQQQPEAPAAPAYNTNPYGSSGSDDGSGFGGGGSFQQ